MSLIPGPNNEMVSESIYTPSSYASTLVYTTVPTSVSSSGTPTSLVASGSYLYVCVGTNSWIRFSGSVSF